MRGRVTGLWTTVFIGSTPIGAVLIGAVTHSFGGRAGLAAGVVGCVAAVAVALFIRRNNPKRRLRNDTYDLDAADFAAIRRNLADPSIVARTGDPVVPSTAHFDDPHKLGVEAMTPPVTAAVGSARTARVQFWPALKDLSMYSLRIRDDGMREPHWHPVTAEMGFVQGGSARMTVMDPDGTIDTWHLNQGDVYFIPRAYPHHIEVVDSPDLHFLIFFDPPTPGDIGYRTSISAYSREVLAATFNTHIDDLPDFPFTKDGPADRHPSQPIGPLKPDSREQNPVGEIGWTIPLKRQRADMPPCRCSMSVNLARK
jgi:hypothetical protein